MVFKFSHIEKASSYNKVWYTESNINNNNLDNNNYIANEEFEEAAKEISEMEAKKYFQKKLIIQGSNKSVEVTIKESGYFEVEGKRIPIENLNTIITSTKELLPTGWMVIPEVISIGCVKNININDLKQVILEHQKLFGNV